LKRAIYPGTFDPITNGHLDIISRAKTIFDEVIIAIASSSEKSPFFTIQERMDMVNIATSDLKNIRVSAFDSLLVEYAKQTNISVLIRGLRAISDFEYELQMSYANESLDKTIDTVFFMPKLENAFVSSTVVREIIKYNGDITHLVPKEVEIFIKKIKCI
jgi:pantetheine-phosphate adenylyltransferase